MHGRELMGWRGNVPGIARVRTTSETDERSPVPIHFDQRATDECHPWNRLLETCLLWDGSGWRKVNVTQGMGRAKLARSLVP